MAVAVLVAGLALAGCGEEPAQTETTVLGGAGPGAGDGTTLTDADGRPIPRPPVPAGIPAQVARSGEESALAVWEQDGQVFAAAFGRDAGWSEARPLEQIYGRASDPQLASNGRGAAMALWRHTVGTIQSLRFSRFDDVTGWSVPDVVPGALPRPNVEGTTTHEDAPRLAMDADGNASASWPSGFAQGEVQSARHAPDQGWSAAVSETVAEAPAGAPASAPASPVPR